MNIHYYQKIDEFCLFHSLQFFLKSLFVNDSCIGVSTALKLKQKQLITFNSFTFLLPKLIRKLWA